MAQTIPQGLKKFRQARAKGQRKAIMAKWIQIVKSEGKLSDDDVEKEAKKRAQPELKRIKW